MKRLTLNQVVKASLKANRKAYRSLILTVFLSVYIATVAVLGGYGTYLAKEAQISDKIGRFDCFVIGESHITDELIRDSGLFSRIGHVFLTAQIGDTGIYTGYYDEAGSELLLRRCVQGRMPERAGEIAIEQSALETMRSDLQVGDTVTWMMNPIYGTAEERNYTLTGILNEQTTYLDVSRNATVGDSVMTWPAALVSAEEPAYAVGNAQINRVLTYAPLVTYSQVEKYCNAAEHPFFVFPISRAEMRAVFWDPLLQDMAEATAQMTLWMIMGGCLLLATGVGISSAMEGVLSRRTEEIGMLRAVGATRRQIRRLFSRDAWIITAASLPGGILLGILTVWGISRFPAGGLLFGLSPWLILPVAGVSALCVFLFSRLPLRRASGQAPMGVLRDTGMLRKAKKFKSVTIFKAPRLISGRQARLHPFRQAGAAVMIALMLVSTSFFVETGTNALEGALWQYDYNFSLSYRGGSGSARLFSEAAEVRTLTDQDLDQIAAIPEVQSIRYTREGKVNLILRGEIPRYLQDTYVGETQATFRDMNGQPSVIPVETFFNVSSLYGSSLNYLLLEEEPERSAEQGPVVMGSDDGMNYRSMRMVQELTGIDGKILPVKILIIDPEDPAIRQAVEEGEIHREALDAGREILVYAPDQYVGLKVQTKAGEGSYVSSAEKKSNYEVEWVAENHNDCFAPRQQLELLQLVEVNSNKLIYLDEKNSRDAYAAMEQRNAAVTVGAVLKGEWWDHMTYFGYMAPTEIAFLTTREGARACGFHLQNPDQVRIKLKGSVDAETEEMIQKKIEQIAMRGNMSVTNLLKSNRETLQRFWQILTLFCGIALVFFLVSVAMQIGNIGRRIQADQRMIGTLRAVGADRNALLACYRLPLLLASAAGGTVGTGIYLLWRMNQVFPKYHPAMVLPLFALLCVLCCVCCLAGVRVRLRLVLNRSVVENIREL